MHRKTDATSSDYGNRQAVSGISADCWWVTLTTMSAAVVDGIVIDMAEDL